MKMRSKIVGLLLVSAAAVVTAQSASAADLPVKAPVYKAPIVAWDWTGLYVRCVCRRRRGPKPRP